MNAISYSEACNMSWPCLIHKQAEELKHDFDPSLVPLYTHDVHIDSSSHSGEADL